MKNITKKNKFSRRAFLNYAARKLREAGAMSSRALIDAYLSSGGSPRNVGTSSGCSIWMRADVHKRFKRIEGGDWVLNEVKEDE